MMVWYTCRGTHAVSMWATCNKKNVFIVFGNSQQHTLAAAAKGQYRCIESHNSQWKVANEGEDRLKDSPFAAFPLALLIKPLLVSTHKLLFFQHIFSCCPSEEGELQSSVVELSCPSVSIKPPHLGMSRLAYGAVQLLMCPFRY